MTTKFIWLFSWLFSWMFCISIGLVVGNALSDSNSLFTEFDAGVLCGFVLGGGMMALYPRFDQR